MEYASTSDFSEYDEEKIIHHPTWYYILRVGGFCISIVLPLIGLICGISSGAIKQVVLFMFCMLPLGFIGFILSFKVAAYCRICEDTLAKYWSKEVRQDGRYSGLIAVCNHCKKYEPRISYDFEGQLAIEQ
jgi:hypothetical protein